MKKIFFCPTLELFHYLPLWKTVRLHGKKLQNATNLNFLRITQNSLFEFPAQDSNFAHFLSRIKLSDKKLPLLRYILYIKYQKFGKLFVQLGDFKNLTRNSKLLRPHCSKASVVCVCKLNQSIISSLCLTMTGISIFCPKIIRHFCCPNQ